MAVSPTLRGLFGLSSLAVALVAGPFGCSSATASDAADTTDAGDGGDAAHAASSANDGGTCPGARPTQGAPCAPEGLDCLFGKNKTGCDSDSASCSQGKWLVFSTPGCALPRDSGTD
jgi:hypothetical protein